MPEPDPFTKHYAASLDGIYDVVDRLVLRAYFSLGGSPGGFRTWWRQLHGTDANLDNAHIMRMAGRFGRRLRAWAQKRNIPVVFCAAGERKDHKAQEYLPKDPNFRGIFAVLISRAPAPVWEAVRFPNGTLDLRRKTSFPLVNHYAFHILDQQWGHVIIRICGQVPFGALVILNGHEYTACQARKAGLAFRKEDNCFTEVSNARGLAKVAETLRSPTAIGRLRQVCERWIYRCLCFGLPFEEQKKSGFRYSYSVFQAEYSRNLLFARGQKLQQTLDGVIDRTRSQLDIKTVKTIFGVRRRRFQRGGKPLRCELVIERPVYDLTIFKVHYGRLTLKAYTKGERVLRIEAIAHHVADLRCGQILPAFPAVIARLAQLLERFLQCLQCVDAPWVGAELLERLSLPTGQGRSRLAGLNLNKPRVRAAMEAVMALCGQPTGFTAAQHAEKVREILGAEGSTYGPRQAAYDIKKLRAKGLVSKTAPSARTYQGTRHGLRAIAALVVLRDKVLLPLLEATTATQPAPRPAPGTPLDAAYERLRREMQHLLTLLNIAA